MTRIMQMNQNAVVLSAVKQMSRSKQRNKDSKRYMNLTDIIADILIAVLMSKWESLGATTPQTSLMLRDKHIALHHNQYIIQESCIHDQ